MDRKIQIVILDDEATAISIVSASVEALLEARGLSANIEGFTSVKRCLQHLEQTDVDLVFLDIVMPEGDGVGVARRIAGMNPNCGPDIVFVSGHEDRVFECLEVQPFGFVRKDNFMSDVVAVMGRYMDTRLNAREEQHHMLQIRDPNGLRLLDTGKIDYIESFRNNQTVHIKGGGSVQLHTTMDDLMTRLRPFRFVRIQRGYIVACANIQTFGRTEVTLFSGEKLPVGRAFYRDAVEQYMIYIRKSGATIL